MGQLATFSIYLKSKITSVESSKITVALKSICEIVKETRNGRHWEALYRDKEIRSFTIHIHKTKEYLWEIENELILLDLTLNETPEVIKIVSNLGEEIDRQYCQSLTNQLASKLECISTNAKLVS